MRKSLVAGVTVLAISVLTGACGSEVTSPGTQNAPAGLQADHNEQDLVFARRMILHLSEVRDMARLVPERSIDPAVLDLAARFMRSQNPDIQQLMRWLLMWGEEYVPTTGNEAVKKLQQVGDEQFDHMWTQLTIERYQSAIALAKTELENGKHPAARQFAQKIIETWQAEVDQMRKLAQP